MSLLNKKRVLFLCLFLFISTTVFAQSYQNEHYRRVSLTLSGGASLGDENDNTFFMSSDYSVNVQEAATFGAGLQYALTPAWSLELGYQRARVKGTDISFETDMNLFTLKNIINLNQIFFVNRISDRVNPYLTAGIGYDVFNYEGPNESFDSHTSSLNAGAGIAFKLTNTLDLFTHYEYHLGSNRIDNEAGGWGSDLINSLTGGIRINFGNSKHLSWRPAPVDLSPSDYNHLVAQAERTDNLTQRLNQLEKRINKNKAQYKKALDKKSTEIDSLKARMHQLSKKTDTLDKAFAGLQEEVQKLEVDKETGIATALPGGDYVQIFASYDIKNAQQVRNHAIEELGESIPNSSDRIFIIHRKQFYEVMIGKFNNYNQASEVQGVMTQVHDDAYVITFPRPINLKPDFKGLEIVER
jgi:opacity protein-like surface antigen